MVVFITGPTKKWKFRETDAKDYQLYARYYDQCVMCQKCVEVCPAEAITVTAETGVSDESMEEELDEEPGDAFAEQPTASD
jgi:formate hydrogenlyase subunit 6/NADH:ubiquinone oxidoreductase subunit I